MKRPLSPHLQIYKLPLNAKLSISHRATGFLLNVSGLVFALLLFFLANGEKSWSGVEPLLKHPLFTTLVYLTVLAVFFHMFNGIRHLLWDRLIGLEKGTVAWTSPLVLVLILAAFLLWMAML